MKRGSERKAGAPAPVVVWGDAQARLEDQVVRLGEKRAEVLKRGGESEAREALRRLRYLEFLHEVLEYEEAA